jgi:spoIIIJ-associated protein
MAGEGQQRIAELKERAKEFAEGLAASSGLEVTARAVDTEEESITLAFDGPDARHFIGRGGQTLDALAYLAGLAIHRRPASGGPSPRLRIVFDADNYRVRREQTLKELAAELSEQVRATGQEAVLDPLSPLERRIVHQALSDEPDVRTYSEGEEPERYIVIAPAL